MHLSYNKERKIQGTCEKDWKFKWVGKSEKNGQFPLFKFSLCSSNKKDHQLLQINCNKSVSGNTYLLKVFLWLDFYFLLYASNLIYLTEMTAYKGNHSKYDFKKYI